MAKISLYQDKPYSLRVYIDELSTDWTSEHPVRTASWYITEDLDATIVDSNVIYTDEQKLSGGKSNSKDKPFTFEGLSPGTEYKIFCVITSSEGTVGGEPVDGIYVELDTELATLNEPIINSFRVYDAEIGSLSCKWSYTCSAVYYGITKLEVQARRQGDTHWKSMLVYDIEGETTDIDPIVVDDYGVYEFQLILRTYEAEVKSSIVTATASSATYDICCYMSSQNGASPNIASCKVSVPSLGVEKTEVYNQDGRDLSVVKIPNGYSVTFDATPADGYVFTQWIYHVGKITPTGITSDDNPLTFNNPSGDIFIRAEGVPIIQSFEVEQPTVDNKTVKWECTLAKEYDKDISYRLMGALYSDDYVEKSSGTIPAGIKEFSKNLTVEKFGLWKFDLLLTINGKEISPNAQLVSVNASPIETSNFNVVTQKGSFNITVNWNTDMKHVGTTYNIYLRKVNEDGSISTVSSKSQIVCSSANIEKFKVTDYGTYSVYILYQIDGANFGENYISDNVVIEEAELGYPSNWEWTSSMEGQLTVTQDGQIHPVTASEWNDFIAMLTNLKNYLEDNKGMSFPDFPSSFSKAEPEAPITDLYNEVSSAMLVLCNNSYGNTDYIYTLSSNKELSAKLFTSLQNNYNYIVNNL